MKVSVPFAIIDCSLIFSTRGGYFRKFTSKIKDIYEFVTIFIITSFLLPECFTCIRTVYFIFLNAFAYGITIVGKKFIAFSVSLIVYAYFGKLLVLSSAADLCEYDLG